MKTRILMVISLFYPCLGGAEQQALLLAQRLVKRGYQVTVLTRRLKNLPSFEVLKDVPVYRSIRVLPWKHWFGLTYILSVFWFLYQNRHSYDVIHCCELHGFHCIVAAFFKVFFNKKVIALVTSSGAGSDFRRLKKSIFGRFFLKKLHGIDRLVALCTQSSQEAMEEGFAKATICLIPNGVDTDLFCPSESTDLDRKRIIFVGRLIYSKGVHVLLQALKLLIDDGIDAQLDVVGDGPERARLEDLANSLGISGSIAFHGNLYGVASLLQMSSVFVLPSFVEGLPNVVLEAMASGLPVVVTKVGGNPDLVNDGTNGVLVDADNPLQLRDALKELLENKDLAEKLGNEARKTIEQKFSIDHITDTYIKLYNDLIRNKS